MEVDLNYDQVNVADESVNPDSLLNHYKRLIRLRSAYSSLRTGSWQALQASDPAVYAYLRHDASSAIVVMMNLGSQESTACTLSTAASPLNAGSHEVEDLLGSGQASALTVADRGAFSGWVPLQSMAPTSAAVLLVK